MLQGWSGNGYEVIGWRAWLGLHCWHDEQFCTACLITACMHALPEQNIHSSSNACISPQMSRMYLLYHVWVHATWKNDLFTAKQQTTLHRYFVAIVPKFSDLYWHLLSRLQPSIEHCLLQQSKTSSCNNPWFKSFLASSLAHKQSCSIDVLEFLTQFRLLIETSLKLEITKHDYPQIHHFSLLCIIAFNNHFSSRKT